MRSSWTFQHNGSLACGFWTDTLSSCVLMTLPWGMATGVGSKYQPRGGAMIRIQMAWPLFHSLGNLCLLYRYRVTSIVGLAPFHAVKALSEAAAPWQVADQFLGHYLAVGQNPIPRLSYYCCLLSLQNSWLMLTNSHLVLLSDDQNPTRCESFWSRFCVQMLVTCGFSNDGGTKVPRIA